MLKYSDIANKTAYFSECCKYALSLLRFSSLDEIKEIEDESKQILSHIVANLSKLNADSKMMLDRMAKTFENVFVPTLYKNYENSNTNNCENYTVAVSKLVTKVTSLIKDKNPEYANAQIDVLNDFDNLTEGDSSSGMRDAKSATVFSNTVLSASKELEKESNKDSDELESQYSLLHNKYKNEAVSKASAIENALTAISSVDKILDSCKVSKILRKEFSLIDEAAVINFLDRDLSLILSETSDTLKSYYLD